MRRQLAAVPFVVALVAAPRASGAEREDTAKADALFESAQAFRAAGKYPEACAAFAESKRLGPGIGVSLYLADCYEHVGKTARAWREFRDAERRARERKDKRAEVARSRANALEPRLAHIGVAISPAGVTAGAEVRGDDGEVVPSMTWTTFVVDPGDHELSLLVSGKAVRTARVRVSAGRWAIVRLDPPWATPAPEPPPALATSAGTAHAEGVQIEPRQAAEYVLLAAGAVGTAIGAGLLVAKNQSLSTGAPDGPARVDQSAAIGSDVAFALGGAAVVGAVILYLTAPARKEAAFVIAPAPLTGGAGGFLSARF